MTRTARSRLVRAFVAAALVLPVLHGPAAVAEAACGDDVYEDNDTLETAAPASDFLRGRACDEDWFKVTAHAGQDVWVALNHWSAGGRLDLEVRDSVGKVRTSTTGGDVLQLVFEVTTSGEHYVRVFADDLMPNGNSYDLYTRRQGALFAPLAQPIRIVDTRDPAWGKPLGLTHGIVQPLEGTGLDEIPPDAVALSATVTVTGATSSGYMTVAADLSAAPTTSTVNVPKGDTRANGVIIVLGAQGAFTARWWGASGSHAHLLVDVTGYFRTNADGSVFVPSDPTRLLDTRTGNGLSGRFASGTVRAFAVAGRGGIPSDATAVTGNLSVVGPTSGGYVSLGPAVTSTPTTSTINVSVGDTRASGVAVGLAGSGALKAVWKGSTGSGTHLLFDVTGYFVDGPDGAAFFPIDPKRVLDTRASLGLDGRSATGVVRTLRVIDDPEANVPGVSRNAIAMTGNLTAIGPTSAGYVSAGPAMTSSPTTSTLNLPARDTRANGVTLPLSEKGSIDLVWKGASGSSVHLVLDTTGYFR